VEAELQAEENGRADQISRSWVEEQVVFEAEYETGSYPWQLSSVEMDPLAGAITIHGLPDGTPTIPIHLSEIGRCEIVTRPDIRRGLANMWVSGAPEGADGGDALLIVLTEIVDRIIAKSTKVPVLKLTSSASDDPDQARVIHLRSKSRGHRGQDETLEFARRFVAFLREAGYEGAIPEELSAPVEDLEESEKGASMPPEPEVSPPSLNRKFWFDFVGAGLLGGLTVGALGGFAAGTALYTVQGGLVAGALGGAVGGLVGGLVQWLALRKYTAKASIWVIVCCLVGVVTWAMATGWAEASGDTWDVIAQVGTWVIAGILAGAVGGAVSGFVQARLLRQRISRVANRWVLVNTVGWAAGGAVFLPAYWGWGIGLIGGGNPGAAAGEAILSNDAICTPVCLPLLLIVPLWALIQAIRQR
jgi:hypothetical protein